MKAFGLSLPVAGCCGLVFACTAMNTMAGDALQHQAKAASDRINVILSEWHIQADKQSVNAGRVVFNVMNRGEEEHEMVIVKTDLAAHDLPVRQGKVIESMAGDVIGEVEEFAAGGMRRAAFELQPGTYVLFCNLSEQEEGELESHYREGMRAVLNVQ
jgi:hypothetical protein